VPVPPRRPRAPRRASARPPVRDAITGQISLPPDPAREAAALRTLAEIGTLSRAPFRRILSRYVEAAPDLNALAAQDEKHPDRWAQGLAIVGRLAGYSERVEVEGSLDVHHLHQLSDLELEARLQELDAKLKALGPFPRSLPPTSPP